MLTKQKSLYFIYKLFFVFTTYLKKITMEKTIKRLSDLLLWSDRLGSDERCEIQEIIKDLKKLKDAK
jgi:hypothetical protein